VCVRLSWGGVGASEVMSTGKEKRGSQNERTDDALVTWLSYIRRMNSSFFAEVLPAVCPHNTRRKTVQGNAPAEGEG